MLEKNIKKIINNKKILKRILILIVIILCVLGIFGKIFEVTIYNFFKNNTLNYIENSYKESQKLFMILSLLKGTTDVIEGSTVNVNAILGMNIEIGDLVQPIYDIIDILWKVSLASLSTLKLETLYYEIFRVKLSNYLVAIASITYIPYTFYKNKITNILKEVANYSFFTFLFIYILIPSTILITSIGTNYIEKEYKEPAIIKLNEDFEKLNKVKNEVFSINQTKSIFNIPGQIEDTKNKFSDLGKEVQNVSQSLVDYVPVIIGIMVFIHMIVPLGIGILVYKLIKSILKANIKNNNYLYKY